MLLWRVQLMASLRTPVSEIFTFVGWPIDVFATSRVCPFSLAKVIVIVEPVGPRAVSGIPNVAANDEYPATSQSVVALFAQFSVTLFG